MCITHGVMDQVELYIRHGLVIDLMAPSHHPPLDWRINDFLKTWIAAVSLIARFMGPTWGPSGADRTQVGPMLAPWTLLTGILKHDTSKFVATLLFGHRVNINRLGPFITISYKQRFLTPGHQGWNDLHSLCRIGMEYYLLNNDDNNIIYWIMMIIMIMMMMIIIMIIMMTMMIIGTATIMIMIIIITTTLTMTIMKMIMIKTAQTPCQSLYKDRR